MPGLARITRRAAIGVLAGAGTTALLWPRESGRRGRAPAGRVEVTYWEKWTGMEAAAMQRVVDAFNQSQDRVWVRMVPVSDITAKAMVAIGGGDPPDVVGLYSYNVPGYAEARAVMPLDEFGGERIDAGAYLPGVRAMLEHEGKACAGVNTCYTLALYYNRAMLAATGRGPDGAPRTVAELDELNDALTVKDAAGRIERAGFLQNIPGWWPYFWPVMFGGRLYDETTGRALVGDEACVRAYEWIAATAGRLGRAESRAFAAGFARSNHSKDDPFISGRVAMVVQGTWLANFIRANGPGLDYGCAPVPTAGGGGEPAGMLEADVLMIPRGCRYPEEAWAFLRYTQRREVQEALALAHCKPSPFAEVSEVFYAGHPNRGIRAHDAVARSAAVQVLPRTKVWKQYSDMIWHAFDAVWGGEDAGRTMRDVAARAQALLDHAAARRAARGGAA